MSLPRWESIAIEHQADLNWDEMAHYLASRSRLKNVVGPCAHCITPVSCALCNRCPLFWDLRPGAQR